MFSRRTLPSCIGIVILSGMFLLGQQGWFNDLPPEIVDVVSKRSMVLDTDNAYPTGSIIRIDVGEASEENDIVEGTIRITSASQGYDSGFQHLPDRHAILQYVLQSQARVRFLLL